jgi:hypothetical protein
MKHFILTCALFALPLFGQGKGVDNLKAFRQDLAAAVSNGSLSAEEKQSYDKALAALDQQKQARKSGGQVDRAAARKALQDLVTISKSASLKEEDRARLAKHVQNAKVKKGRKGKTAKEA